MKINEIKFQHFRGRQPTHTAQLQSSRPNSTKQWSYSKLVSAHWLLVTDVDLLVNQIRSVLQGTLNRSN